jgi:hypothetical protein
MGKYTIRVDTLTFTLRYWKILSLMVLPVRRTFFVVSIGIITLFLCSKNVSATLSDSQDSLTISTESTPASFPGESTVHDVLPANSMLLDRLTASVERVSSISAKLTKRFQTMQKQDTGKNKSALTKISSQLNTLSTLILKVSSDLVFLKKNLSTQTMQGITPAQYSSVHRQISETRGRLEETVVLESSILTKLKLVIVPTIASGNETPATGSSRNP